MCLCVGLGHSLGGLGRSKGGGTWPLIGGTWPLLGAGKRHCSFMVLLKVIATSIVLVSWTVKFFCFDADLVLGPPTPAKWHALEEASQEIRGFQRYVAALAAYDTSVDEPVFLGSGARLWLGSSHRERVRCASHRAC